MLYQLSYSRSVLKSHTYDIHANEDGRSRRISNSELVKRIAKGDDLLTPSERGESFAESEDADLTNKDFFSEL